MSYNNSVTKLGLYFDELNKIRVWDPESAAQTKDLEDTCHNFLKMIDDFNKMSGKLVEAEEELSQQVDRQKMKTLGVSNLLMSTSKLREAQKHQYQALILEKTTELERLRTQHQALLQTEIEQQETLAILQQQI